MKYWSEDENGKKVPVQKTITKQETLRALAYIKGGHLPDWNYKTRNGVVIPDEHYPLHVAMQVAAKAVEAMDDGFFEKLDKEYRKYDEVPKPAM